MRSRGVPGADGAFLHPLCLRNWRSSPRYLSKLQEARQQADYDNAKIWVSIDALDKVADAQTAFENWAKIRTHPAANEYLLSLLIGNKRE